MLKAVPLLVSENYRFKLNEDVAKYFAAKDVRNMNVAVVSVAGAYRKGKSFILDFFLRYANNVYSKQRESEDWLPSPDDPLKGFSWRGGSSRVTSGILLWPEFFICTTPGGYKVCLLLLDTQGTCDDSPVSEWATIFAVSTMLSSLQVYNVSQDIREDHLHHLEFFSDYGRLAIQNSGTKPFQKLLFLVRDWSNPHEYEFGAKGGKKLLDRKMNPSAQQTKELVTVRQNILSCYENIECFLMPHPGLKAATAKQFDGRLRDLEQNFIDQLKELAPLALAPENLMVKRVNGEAITTKHLFAFLKAWTKIFNRPILPTPTTVYNTTAQVNNLVAKDSAFNKYNEEMRQRVSDKYYINPDRLDEAHLEAKELALSMFAHYPKMGTVDMSEAYEIRLLNDIDKMFQEYKRRNEARNFWNKMWRLAQWYLEPMTMLLSLYILHYLDHKLGWIPGFKLAAEAAMVVIYLLLCWWVVMTLWALYVTRRFTRDH